MAVIASAQITLSAVVDVKAVYRYYLLQSSTLSAPSQPTTTPASAPSGWSASEPTYTEGSTNSLYTVDGTLFSDDTWSWANVQLSSSYEAAKAAYNKAVAANSAATAAKGKLMYGTCGTAAGTAAKTVTISGFSLAAGATVAINFTYANTAASPTLNVSSTGAKNIRMNNANLTVSNSWGAGEMIVFVYDGEYWVMQSPWKSLRASNGLTGTSNKTASVSAGYPDSGATGDMRAELYAFGGTNVSQIDVYPEYINLMSSSVRINGEEIDLSGGTPTLEEVQLSSTYGVYAWNNSMGVVTISSESWNDVPAGAQWSTVTFGTLPEGWRPGGLLQTPVLLNGTQHVVQILANGTVQLVRMVAQNGAAPCIFTVTFVTA